MGIRMSAATNTPGSPRAAIRRGDAAPVDAVLSVGEIAEIRAAGAAIALLQDGRPMQIQVDASRFDGAGPVSGSNLARPVVKVLP